MEAAGTLSAVKLAFSLIRRGTRIALHGITTEGEYSIQPGDLHFLETEIKSSFSITPYAMQKSVDLQEL